MHDLDRTLNEYELGMDAMEAGDFEFEFGYGQGETTMDEMDEMELAAGLLEVADEQELEEFIGKLVKKAGAFIKSPAGRALGGLLKQAAKKVLPMAGAALGNMIAPGVGGAIGGKLAGMAGQAFGLELEGMSPPDQEFEVARHFVRFANEAAAALPQFETTAPPVQAARQAALQAAQTHAPGLVRALATAGTAIPGRNGAGAGRGFRPRGGGNSGRWVKQGGKIVLYGVG
jgi:hypothetical protein